MNKKNILIIIAAVTLVALVGLGVYFASQTVNNQSPDSAFACVWACSSCKCGCSDDKDVFNCPGSNVVIQGGNNNGNANANEKCGSSPKGTVQCSGTSQVSCVCQGAGNCGWQTVATNVQSCGGTPPGNNSNTGSGTTAPASNKCNATGSASQCANQPVGTSIPIAGGSCLCTVNADNNVCGCKPTTGSTCGTGSSGDCPNKGLGAACGSGAAAGTCVGGNQGLVNCSCKPSSTAATNPPISTTPGSATACNIDSDCGSGRWCNQKSCAEKLINDAACSSSNQCLSNNCYKTTTSGTCKAQGYTAGTTTTPGTGVTGSACTSDASCSTGFVCQGTAGSQKCQKTNECKANTDGTQDCNINCNTQGATCSGTITFTCNQLTNGQCNSNPSDTAGTPSCGQVDKVWVGGPCNRQLCGGFTIYNNCSGGGSSATSSTTTTGGTTTPVAPPPVVPPPPAGTPYCGDAVCATGELCEATSPDGTTYKACGAIGSSPTGATLAACYGTNFKQAVTTNTCKYCGDGTFTPGQEQCDSTAPATGGNNPTQCDATCHLQQAANVCVSMTENGVDPIRSGASNFIEYTIIFQNNATTNPFPSIRLLVSTGNTVATAVGRDANNTSSALVAPITSGGYSYDAVTSRHTYKFRWESVSTAGVAVPNATYQVRALTDGTDAGVVTSPGACTESLTASSSAVQEPVFNIIKTGVVACTDNSDATINYTVTVTNNGPVSGVIDFVTDTVDTKFTTLGITPTNISPAYGAYASGVITWTGDVSARTYAAGQSKTFTYSVVIPVGQLLNFAGSGVQNLATVQYDTNTTTNNTDSFNLRTQLYCTINGIPITGIFDDGRLFLFGLIFIILGFIAYRYQLGKTISERFLMSAEGGVEKLMPFEDRIERKMKRKTKGEK